MFLCTNYEDFLKKYHFEIHDKRKELSYPFSSIFEKKINNLSQEEEFIILDFEKKYGSNLK